VRPPKRHTSMGSRGGPGKALERAACALAVEEKGGSALEGLARLGMVSKGEGRQRKTGRGEEKKG